MNACLRLKGFYFTLFTLHIDGGKKRKKKGLGKSPVLKHVPGSVGTAIRWPNLFSYGWVGERWVGEMTRERRSCMVGKAPLRSW